MNQTRVINAPRNKGCSDEKKTKLDLDEENLKLNCSRNLRRAPNATTKLHCLLSGGNRAPSNACTCKTRKESKRRLGLPQTYARQRRKQAAFVPTEERYCVKLYDDQGVSHKFPLTDDTAMGFDSISAEWDKELSNVPPAQRDDDDCRTPYTITAWAASMIEKYLHQLRQHLASGLQEILPAEDRLLLFQKSWQP